MKKTDENKNIGKWGRVSGGTFAVGGNTAQRYKTLAILQVVSAILQYTAATSIFIIIYLEKHSRGVYGYV